MRPVYYYLVVGLIFYILPRSCYGQYYFKHYQVDDGLLHNSVTSIIQDSKGLIWIGTEDAGLNKFDLKTRKFTNYTTTEKGSISYPNIHGLLAAPKAFSAVIFKNISRFHH